MIIVIIAGGSGTRLWPISTPDYPKHLLKINGDKRSLLQHSYDRAVGLTDKVYLITDSSHVHHVEEQLPELNQEAIIVEPARRGTASCILATLTRVADKHDSSEPIGFVPADHYIRDIAGFNHSFKLANEASSAGGKIVLVGVEPDYPATGFGYIQKGDISDEDRYIFKVQTFKEKPDHDTAKAYLDSGNYLWNCSYFVGSIDTFSAAMKKYSPDLYDNYNRLKEVPSGAFNDVYLGLENISIDYALIEKVPDLLVVPASFDWMDLGSFIDLSKAVGADENGNHVTGSKVELDGVNGTFIQNYEDKPLAVIGLDNCVVINSPNGLLVARKDMSQKVGDISKRFIDPKCN